MICEKFPNTVFRFMKFRTYPTPWHQRNIKIFGALDATGSK
jgi:hypothetical protein